MTIKFSSSPANQYLSMADSAGLTYPAGDFCLSWVVVIDTPSGSNPEYLISNGPFQSTGSLNIFYDSSTNGQHIGSYIGATGSYPSTRAFSTAGTKLAFVLQRSGTTLTLRSCPVLSALPTDGTSVVVENTTTGFTTTALDGSGGMVIGGRSDLTAARFANQSIGRVFRYDGTLTDLEVAKLAYGMEITDLGKSPAWYIRMDTATDITDRGIQQNTVTPNGAFVTGTSPGFGYAGASVAPAITNAPSIVGGASVGSASSVTPGATTGNPTPTNTFQWNLNGVAVSGATGTTYTPVSGDVGKTLTVTQTATNGVGSPATSTSAGIVVTAATSNIDVTQITAERIFQRASGVASIAMSGTYTSTLPTSIEYQMYAADGATVLVPWTAITGAVISSGTWSGTPAVAQGGMYRLCVRSKNGSTVLATSNIKANLFGVGDIFAWIGSSSANIQFNSSSGTGNTPGPNVRMHASGAWALFGTDGCAITTANDLAARLGVPVGMMSYGVGAVTLANWLDQTNVVWTNFVAAINNVGGKIAGLYNSVGSNDAANGLVSSRASHLANLRQLIANVRTLTGLPSLKVLHSGFNRRPAVSDTAANYVRMAECDFGDDANVYHIQTVDFPIRDDDLIHMTPAGFIACAARTQAVFGQVLTGGSYIRGPKITSLVWSGNTVTFTLQHRNGTDFTPTSAIKGFTVTDSDSSGVAPTVTSVARTSSITGVITFNRTLVNPVARYLSGSAPVSQSAAAPTNEVFDNGAPSLPMTVETDMATTQATGDTTAPILSAASATTTGPNTATGSVTTNEAGGTLYYLASTSATATAAQVKAGASQAVSSSGAQSVSFTGLTQVTQYYPHYLHTDAAGNDSAVLDGAAFTTAATPDTTAPTISAATASPNGAYAATGSVTTNEGNGTLYYLASASTSLTAAQVKAGATQAISSAGAKGVAVSGLAAATIYYLFFLHRDAAGNDSSVLRSASFTTAAAPTNPSTIDATKVPASRTVTFPGNKRVVTF